MARLILSILYNRKAAAICVYSLVEQLDVKERTTQSVENRWQRSNGYHLIIDGVKQQVRMKIFMDTFALTEMQIHTIVKKKMEEQSTGVIVQSDCRIKHGKNQLKHTHNCILI